MLQTWIASALLYEKIWFKNGLLTVEHSEDLLHHLPQNKDVGLGI